MGSGNRASMREGPLAALFRKTEEEGIEPREEPQASQREEHTPEAEASPEPEARPEESAPPRVRPLSEPDPSPAPEAEAAVIPSPEERLRNVFSSDIPENVMERPAPPAAERPVAEPETRVAPEIPTQPVLRVVGVGGAGVNAVNRMIDAQVEGVEFIALNTDLQSLEQSQAQTRLHIGSDATRGLGSGSDPELGRESALEDYDDIKALLKGADMVFVTAGGGGGTGTGAAPVVARVAREVGALTVGIITKPFPFEGVRRGEQADVGIEEFAEAVDTLITVPNERLLSVLDKKTTMVEAFRVADDVLRQGVQGISDLVTLPGLINLDFADVRTIMSEAGNALLGIGMGTGDQRAVEAAEAAVESPLLETSIDGAHSILLSITGGRDLSLWEVNEAAKVLADAAHPDANIIFGAMVDDKIVNEVWVTVVATGYDDERPLSRRPRPDRVEEREPAEVAARRADHEPKVVRAPERRPSRSPSRANGLDIDVPEFLPNS